MITIFFPFNCIFAIIKLFNNKKFMKIIILNGPNLNLLGEREKINMEILLLKMLKKIVMNTQIKMV